MIDMKIAAVEAPKVSRQSRRGVAWSTVAVVVLVASGGAAMFTGLPAMLHTTPTATASVAPAPAGVPVSVAVVEQRDATIWNEFSGRLEAVGRVEVRPRVAGAIVQANFREGALVKQGDLLFTIDPAPYVAAVARSQAQVASAIARVVLAAKDQQRGFKLGNTNDLAQSVVDQRVNEFQAAQANLSAAQAALDTSKLDLAWTEVRAPISGRVGKIEVTPGNLVPAGSTAPVLTTLVSVNPIYASFDADERTVTQALASLPGDTDVSSQIDRIPVQMNIAAADATPRKGRLQLIDNVVDLGSGTVRVRAVFDNPDGRLMPGQFARLHLGQAKAEPILAVAESALGTDQDRRFVMVVGDDNKVAYREVHLGAMAGGLRVVTSGLHAGERIVVNGLQRIRPGALVAPQAVAMAPSDTTLASR